MAHEQLIFRNIEVLPSTWQIWKGQGDAEKESEQFPYMAFVPCEGINSYSTGLRVTFDQSDPTISLFAASVVDRMREASSR